MDLLLSQRSANRKHIVNPRRHAHHQNKKKESLTDFWSPPLIRCIANPPRTIVGGPGDLRGAQSMAGRLVLSLMSDT